GRRVADDAAVLSVAAVLACGTALWMEPIAALASLACVPALALRASGYMRVRDRAAAEWRPIAEGTMLAGLICLLPWLALLVLLSSPAALAWAAERERRLKGSS